MPIPWPIFDAQGRCNGRISIQTDPRFYRDAKAIVEQAVHFSQSAPNTIVKILPCDDVARVPAADAAARRLLREKLPV